MSRLTDEQLRYMSKNEQFKLVGLLVAFAFSALLVYRGLGGGVSTSPEPVFEIGSERPPGQQRITGDAAAMKALFEEKLRREEAGEAEAAPIRTAVPVAIDPAVLRDVEDMVKEDIDRLTDDAYFHLVSVMAGMPDEELAQAPEQRGTFDWDDLLERKVGPDGKTRASWSEAAVAQARGKFVKRRGKFFTRIDQRVLPQHPLLTNDVPWVWQGFFRTTRNEGFYVTVVDKTWEPETGEFGDPIELTGVFHKIYSFTAYNDERGQVQAYPHLVAKTFEHSPVPEGDYYPYELAYVAVGLVTIMAIALVLYARATRGDERRYDDWRRQRLGKKKPGSLTPGAGAGAEAPAGSKTGSETPAEKPSEAPASPTPGLAACPGCELVCGPGPETVVCGDCLRRHHAKCWVSSCGACGGTNKLVAATPGPTPGPTPDPTPGPTPEDDPDDPPAA